MASALTESQVVANELERVLPKVPTLFDRDDVFYSSIDKKNVEVISGRDMRIPLELRPGGRFGHFDPDGGDLGRGSGPVFDKAVINSVHFKMGVEWTKKSEWATDDSRKAVLNTFRHLLAKSMSEFRRHVDSACMTAGSGVVANPSTVTAAGGTGGGDLWTVPATDGFGVRLLRFGQDVGIYDTTLATFRGNAAINFYDSAARRVDTFPATAGVAATDKLVLSGLSTPPVGMFGVPYHDSNASSGTWLGFDRATTPEIRANRVNAAGALALPFPRLARNKVGDRVGIENMGKTVAWMHPCQQQAYEEIGQAMTLLNGVGSMGGKLYSEEFQFAGAPGRNSFSWDKTRIDFINSGLWGRAELNPAGFYEVDGQKIFPIRGSSGGLATSMIFYLVASFNLFLNNPAMGSYIDGLTIPTGY